MPDTPKTAAGACMKSGAGTSSPALKITSRRDNRWLFPNFRYWLAQCPCGWYRRGGYLPEVHRSAMVHLEKHRRPPADCPDCGHSLREEHDAGYCHHPDHQGLPTRCNYQGWRSA